MIDAETVITRLQAANVVVKALPGRVGPAALSAQSYGYVSEVDAKAIAAKHNRVQPSRSDIAEMDEALGWLPLIDNLVIRRIVALRSLVASDGERHIHSWRDIGRAVGASHGAVAGWYALGIDAIVDTLNGRGA